MDLAWPICKYPFGSGGNRVRTLPAVALRCDAISSGELTPEGSSLPSSSLPVDSCSALPAPFTASLEAPFISISKQIWARWTMSTEICWVRAVPNSSCVWSLKMRSAQTRWCMMCVMCDVWCVMCDVWCVDVIKYSAYNMWCYYLYSISNNVTVRTLKFKLILTTHT